MSEIVPFNYGAQQVRTVTGSDGEPWFVAADVCAVLGIVNVGNAVGRLDGADKGLHPVDTPGGRQNLGIINESGLYDLVLDSRKPQAKKFRRWITSEVVPAINRTGSYSVAARREPTSIDALRGMLDQIEAAQQTARRAEETALESAETSRETAARLDAIEGRHEWFAALGFAKLHDLPTSAIYLRRLGAEAGRVGRAHGVTPNKVEHALYGEVNQWPAWVWSEALENRRDAP